MTLSSYHPENVKKIANKYLKCVECGDPVYAKYQCRKHYDALQRKRDSDEKRAKREARLKEIQLELETNGEYCGVPSCTVLTLRDTGLCKAHEGRAKRWQLTPSELISILSESECRICGATENLVLDHKHGMPCEVNHSGDNGCIQCFRGVLCSSCNYGIGLLKDCPERIRNALRYLESDSQ